MSGSMTTFGLSGAVPEVAVAEETAPKETDPVETAPEEAAPEDPPVSKLARVRGSYNAPREDGGPAAQVQRDMDALKGSVAGSLSDIRNEIRALGQGGEDDPAAAPATGSLKVNYEDPKIGEAFREVYDSDDPAAFGRAVGAMVKMGVDAARQEIGERLDQFEADAGKAKDAVDSNKNFASNMTKAIPHIRAIGESESTIVDDYLENGDASFLGQYFRKFPTLTQDEQGIMGAALAVARMVDIADARLGSTPAGEGESVKPTERSVRTEAAPSSGSNRSVQRIKDDAEGKGKTELTPAEVLRKSIVEAGSPARNLPKVFHA